MTRPSDDDPLSLFHIFVCTECQTAQVVETGEDGRAEPPERCPKCDDGQDDPEATRTGALLNELLKPGGEIQARFLGLEDRVDE